MKKLVANATQGFEYQKTDQFRKLVERKITADEYVRDLERRASELSTEGAPAAADDKGADA